jgi:hypothetical protein
VVVAAGALFLANLNPAGLAGPALVPAGTPLSLKVASAAALANPASLASPASKRLIRL